MTASRSAAIVALVLAGVVIGVRAAGAGTINLIQEQETWIDPDCVAIPEHGFVYVMCAERARQDFGFGGGMQLAAALSWSAAASTSPLDTRRITNNASHAGAGAEPAPPAATPEPPWSDPPPAPGQPPPSLPTTDANDAPPRIGSSDILPAPVEYDPPIVLDPREWADPPVFIEPPIVIDPVNGIVTPEPAAWLLTGTGLAAVWRASRKRKDRS